MSLIHLKINKSSRKVRTGRETYNYVKWDVFCDWMLLDGASLATCGMCFTDRSELVTACAGDILLPAKHCQDDTFKYLTSKSIAGRDTTATLRLYCC